MPIHHTELADVVGVEDTSAGRYSTPADDPASGTRRFRIRLSVDLLQNSVPTFPTAAYWRNSCPSASLLT